MDWRIWEKERQGHSMAESIEASRHICIEEDYELDPPERWDRPNSFAEALDEVPA